jgi:hypothetical protein
LLRYAVSFRFAGVTRLATPPQALAEARAKCTELFHRVMMSQATVSSGFEVQRAFPDLKRQVTHSHLSGESHFRAMFAEIRDESVPWDEDTFARVADVLAKQTTVNIETIISAAMLVLSHSTADDVFTQVCGLSIDLAPSEWKSELSLDRKVSLQDVFSKGQDGVLISELDHLKNRLGGKSLPNRADLLFSRVPIKLHKDIPKDESSYYRGERLREVDGLRHQIIHGASLPVVSLGESAQAVHFLHEAAHTAIRSLLFAFNLTINAEYLGELTGLKPSS